MEYVYAALLLHSAGKDVNEDGIKKVVEASGVAADEVRIKALVAALEGVDIATVLSQAAAVTSSRRSSSRCSFLRQGRGKGRRDGRE